MAANTRPLSTIFTWIILSTLVVISGGFQCYQCIDSGNADTDCQDAALLLNDTNTDPEEGEEWRRNDYYKDCNNSFINYTMCMIEIHSVGGVIRSFHRDCSDGETFSFSGGDIEFPRLYNLIPNNETTCSYHAISNLHVCLQLCEGDMCNGPQIPPEPEIVCYNVTDDFTGEQTTICGASSLNVIFQGLSKYHVLIPVLLYALLFVVFV